MKITIVGEQGCRVFAEARGLLHDHDLDFNVALLDAHPELQKLLKDNGVDYSPVFLIDDLDDGGVRYGSFYQIKKIIDEAAALADFKPKRLN